MRTMSVSDARAHLPELIDQVNGKSRETVGIVRRGESVATIMSTDLYESMVETLEILSDPETTGLLKEAIRNAKKAKFIPMAEVMKDLEIEL